MTNSAKTAFYAPTLNDVDVVLASLNQCIGGCLSTLNRSALHTRLLSQNFGARLTALAFGIVLGNDKEIFHILKMSLPSPAFSEVKTYLMRFHGEISFILRTFFFVLLGLIFDMSESSLVVALSYGLPIIGILLIIRYVVTSASTWKSPMSSDKGIITGMCALGLTPALLSFIPLQYSLPNAYVYTITVTNIITITNIITSITTLKSKMNQKEETKSHSNPIF